MVKFNRFEPVQHLGVVDLPESENSKYYDVTFTIIGIIDDGPRFTASNVVQVIMK